LNASGLVVIQLYNNNKPNDHRPNDSRNGYHNPELFVFVHSDISLAFV